MARIPINTGSQANDGTGDDLRSAFTSVNTMFTELYAASAVSHQIAFSGNKISSNATNANLKLTANGTGVIELEGIQIRDNHIEGIRTNDDLHITPSGTGNLILGALRLNGTTISSDDSSSIKINETLHVNEISSDDSSAIVVSDDVHVSGTLRATTVTTNTINSEDSTAVQITDNINVSGNISGTSLDINEISSGDSTAIQINDSVNILGTLTATTITGQATLTHGTLSTSETSVNASGATAIDSFSTSSFRSAKYIVQVSDSTNSRFEVQECLIVHGPSSDSTTEAFITVFGSTGNTSTQMTTLTADINDANVRLLATNNITDNDLVFRFVRTVINA